ncbi:hypothetical protein M5D96_005681 [Drosophila gunungcola]|uniref:Uncharacterized protein n=1 Tax=Drosophila gunungcola TaxID=103775 RepID=A0A9Q0BR12_9MUSC|nr:hypothetical protein M5D96_005681 [Drosophila gunungcola]
MAKRPRRIISHWGMLDPEIVLGAWVPDLRTVSPSSAARWVGGGKDEDEGPRSVGGGPGPQDVGINSIAAASVAQFSRLSLLLLLLLLGLPKKFALLLFARADFLSLLSFSGN